MPEAGAVSPAMEKGHQVRARRYVTVFCKTSFDDSLQSRQGASAGESHALSLCHIECRLAFILTHSGQGIK